METRKDQPNKLLLAVSAIIICFFCGISLVIPKEPMEWPQEFAWFVPLYILIAFLVPFWIKSIWNNVLPAIGPFKEISYWQALGLVVLVSILTILIPD